MPPTSPPSCRISVVLNCFNGAAFLREAVDSVLAQTFRNWELVAWDDQSSDGTAEILKSYTDPRIRYFFAPVHTHLGDARQRAVEHARGEWLAFLDQDDVWAPDKLERQVALIDSEGDDLGLVYGRATRFGEGETPRDYDRRHEFAPLPEGRIFDDLVRESNFIPMSSSMVRRQAFFDAGGIPSDCRIVPDYLIFLAVSRRWRARAVQEPCCWHRMHGGNMSFTTKLRSHQEALGQIHKWRAEIDPRVHARRVRIYETLIGVEEIAGEKKVLGGAARILRKGSLAYLLSRPLARALRAARRVVRRPFAAHRAPPR